MDSKPSNEIMKRYLRLYNKAIREEFKTIKGISKMTKSEVEKEFNKIFIKKKGKDGSIYYHNNRGFNVEIPLKDKIGAMGKTKSKKEAVKRAPVKKEEPKKSEPKKEEPKNDNDKVKEFVNKLSNKIFDKETKRMRDLINKKGRITPSEYLNFDNFSEAVEYDERVRNFLKNKNQTIYKKGGGANEGKFLIGTYQDNFTDKQNKEYNELFDKFENKYQCENVKFKHIGNLKDLVNNKFSIKKSRYENKEDVRRELNRVKETLKLDCGTEQNKTMRELINSVENSKLFRKKAK